MSAGSSSSGRTKDFVMSQRKTRDVSKLIKDLEKLVSRHMKEREDRKLKGLLLYLKGNVLRNSVHAEHFRTEGGVSLLCTLLQKYSSIRDSVIATVMSLLANLTALDGKTKQEMASGKNVNYVVQVLEMICSADVVNCTMRLLSNLSNKLKDGSLLYRIHRMIAYHLGITNDANCQKSLLRACRHFGRNPSCRKELLKHEVIQSISKLVDAKDKDLALDALNSLSVLSTGNVEALVQVCVLPHFASVIGCMVDSDGKMHNSATALVLECMEHPECRPRVAASGGIPILIQLANCDKMAATSHHESNIVRALCLACHDVACRQELKTHDGLDILMKELLSNHCTVDNSMVKLILRALMGYCFDRVAIDYMVHRLNLIKVLTERLKELVACLSNQDEAVVLAEDDNTHCTESSLDLDTVESLSNVSSTPSFISSELLLSDDPKEDTPASSVGSPLSTTSSPLLGDQEIGGSTHESPLVSHSPEWNNDSGNEGSSHTLAFFESLAESTPDQPSSSRKFTPDVTCKGFQHSPHNLLDSILKAPSPYQSKAAVKHLEAPGMECIDPQVHPLLVLLSWLSHTADYLPLFAQADTLVLLIEYCSFDNGETTKCLNILKRILQANQCLELSILALAPSRIWQRMCLRLKGGGNVPGSPATYSQIDAGCNLPRKDVKEKQLPPYDSGTLKKSAAGSSIDALILAGNSSLSPLDLLSATQECAVSTCARRGADLLRSFCQSANSDFGRIILTRLLQKEETAKVAAITLPFVCSDLKIMRRMLSQHKKVFDSLLCVLQHSENESPLIIFALDTLFIMLQQCRIGITCLLPYSIPPERERTTQPLFTNQQGKSLPQDPTALQQTQASNDVSLFSTAGAIPSPSFCPKLSPPIDLVPYTDCSLDTSELQITPTSKRARVLERTCCYTEACKRELPDVAFLFPNTSNQSSKEQESVLVHKHVLSSKSEVFNAMLTGSFKESSLSEILLQNTDKTTFESMVHHVYGCRNCTTLCSILKVSNHGMGDSSASSHTDKGSNCISPSNECDTWNIPIHLDLLDLSRQYFLVALQRDCESVLCQCIEPDNVVELFREADIHQADTLSSHCIEHIFSISNPVLRKIINEKLLKSGHISEAFSVLKKLIIV